MKKDHYEKKTITRGTASKENETETIPHAG
jgi:hypothetical protein